MAARLAAAVALMASVGVGAVSSRQGSPEQASTQQVYKPGPGVTSPVLLRQEQPRYTSDALRAKIQGVVELEAVVQANGTVGEVRVLRSLDRVFGLDDQAIAAAKKWLFRPGIVNGEAVPVMVHLLLEFKMYGGPGGVATAPAQPAPGTAGPPPTQAGGAAPTTSAVIVEDDFFKDTYASSTPRLVAPKVVSRVHPTYTREAMDAKLQGTVTLDVVVLADGTVGRSRVAKSLDDRLGLDAAALTAANQWRFEPGRLNGQAVPVAVTVVIEFKLH